jgi:hypothetical protein
MKVPIQIAEKLLQLLKGECVPSSSAKHSLIDDLVIEGIVERRGRIQKSLFVRDSKALITYLQNKCSINDLQQYIQIIRKEDLTRTELIIATSDSKHRGVRSFKGFLVNSITPILAELDGKQITINPDDGSFQFIYDYEKFSVSPDITIVGIENPANFRHINKQRYLFSDLKPLFVSRYPQNQSKDLIKWLQTIPNNYLHFGDFDFAGIGIYLNEFKKHLADKASFLVPENIENLTQEFGNKKRYDVQKINFDIQTISEIKLLKLIDTIHKWKKGLDQEILIRE